MIEEPLHPVERVHQEGKQLLAEIKRFNARVTRREVTEEEFEADAPRLMTRWEAHQGLLQLLQPTGDWRDEEER